MPSLCVFHPIWVLGGGASKGAGVKGKTPMQFSSLGSSKMEISETDFSDTLTIQNDQISCVAQFLVPPFCVFHPIWVLGGGSRGHNQLMQFSNLGSSKKKDISETDFSDTLTIQNNQMSYVKHTLAPLYVFFTLFGCLGGGSRGLGHNPLMQFSSLGPPSPLFEVPCRRQ